MIPWRLHSSRDMSGFVRARDSMGIGGESSCEEGSWTFSKERQAVNEATLGGEVNDVNGGS